MNEGSLDLSLSGSFLLFLSLSKDFFFFFLGFAGVLLAMCVGEDGRPPGSGGLERERFFTRHLRVYICVVIYDVYTQREGEGK